MKTGLNISIRQRIYWSFSLLVFLFVINGIITIITINSNKKLTTHLSKVIDPSLKALEDFGNVLIESKMYSTNWVFLRYNREDKKLLEKLHNSDYEVVKLKLNSYTSQWQNKNWIDSLNRLFTDFEELLAIEKNIMTSLKEFKDYDDPVIKLEAERKVEEEILPRTTALINSLDAIRGFGGSIRAKENTELERSSEKLRIIIIVLAITIILAGFFLSIYMAKAIIDPVNRIRYIINNLGQGIIQKIDQPANSDEIGEMIYSVNNLSKKLQATATFAHETGLRNFDMPFKPLSDEDTLGKALMAMRDNLKSNETNLEIKNSELERKNKELEQFAYIASHDMQEPLRTTSNFAELLQRRYKGKLDEKADEYFTFILQSAERMRVLIKDLLDYSRIGKEKEWKPADCNVILQETLADLTIVIKETHAEIKYSPLPVINGNPTEIKQLFQNLIINAIKFRKKEVNPQINISVKKIKGYYEFAITDNGIGIDKKYREKVFIIFQRLHNRTEYKGSGIGLAHCKKIVELHGGKIWVDSEPGKGSTFYFTIRKNIIGNSTVSIETK